MSLRKFAIVVTLTLLVFPSIAFSQQALPEGENVVAGEATFSRDVNTLTITTPSDNLIVNYNSFNIAQSNTVNFIQPSASSVALNRVIGVDPSSILGTLTANGRIFLINPNGVIFGAGARVDVPALVASTLDISNQDFLNGNYNFFKNGENAFIINQGNIKINNGGYVCLLSQAVENQGTIQADLGTIVLASGEKMTLALDDLNDISVVIDEGVKEAVLGPDGKKIDSAIKNTGTISANGGKVILTAKVLNKVFDYAINNEGVVEAKKLVSSNGVVELIAEGAPIYNTGKIEAGEVKVSAPGTDFINKGIIISNGTPGLPDGGRISIEAGTILQQGLISANALEGGTAGEVIIVSQTSTVLDEGSRTEAKVLGLVGNGGRITIGSTAGNTVINKNAVVDISGGPIIGNAGTLELSAYKQLGFYGLLNGRAPPGHGPTIIINNNPNLQQPIISTDKSDYLPNEKPIISGFGFLPNKEITLNVSNPDGTNRTLTTVTDSEGNFSLTYEPATLTWGTYVVTSTDGATSAAATFTDKDVYAYVYGAGEMYSNTVTISITIINGGENVEPGKLHNIASVKILLTDIYNVPFNPDGTPGSAPIGYFGTIDPNSVIVTGDGISEWGIGPGDLVTGVGYLAISTSDNNSAHALDPGESMTITFSVQTFANPKVDPPTPLPAPADPELYYTRMEVTAFHNSQMGGSKFKIFYPDSDILQITQPTGGIIINEDPYGNPPFDSFGGAIYTNIKGVKLSLYANDDNGITAFKLSNDGANWSAEIPVSPAETDFEVPDYSWNLADGNDGIRSVYVQYKKGEYVWSIIYHDEITLDTTPPVITAGTPSGIAGLNGWYKGDVTVPFSATDNLSGFEPDGALSKTLASKTTTGEGATLYVTPDGISDRAGNAAIIVPAGPYKVDKTPPTITASIAPTLPDGLNGWYVSHPTVSYSVVETGSGIDLLNSDSSDDVMPDGENQVATGYVQDMAGWHADASITNIDVDTIPPVVAITSPLDGSTSTTPQTLIYTAEDILSGIDSTTPPSGETYSNVDDYDITVTATDKAGNKGQASVSFSIEALPAPAPGINQQELLRYKLPYLEQFAPGQVNPFDFITSSDLYGPVFFYHPLTESDSSAFAAMEVGADAYEFINGALNLLGHDGLLRMFDELDSKKKNKTL